MKEKALRSLYFVVLTVLSISIISCSKTKKVVDSPKSFEKKTSKIRKFHFEYEADFENLPKNREIVEIWIPVPRDNDFQKITNMGIDAPIDHTFKVDELRNKLAYFRLDKSFDRDFSVSLKFDVERKEHINLRPSDNPETSENIVLKDAELKRFLSPNRLVPIDGKIKKWADEVVKKAGAKTDLQKARAVYEHIVATVKYNKSGKGWGRGDIYFACDERRGNCTDFHAIFIGYLRALGIPARFAIGFPLPSERGSADIEGYHCWAEFYLEGYGWIPIDASEAAKNPEKREYFFGALDENRVEFTIGRDLVLEPKQTGEPLNYFVYPYVEVDGKEYRDFETAFKIVDSE